MSWDPYITSLIDGGDVEDAVIVGCEPGKESVWASHKGGTFGSITPEEIRKLVANDRSALFSSGVTVAGMRCTTLRDALNTEGQYTLDLKTKSSDQVPDTYGITVAKSKQALVIVKGKKDTHGGKLNTKAYKMAEHLRNSNY
ncbi:profilin-1 [Anguilla rostrata]|uniref:profilin-1 n=1 Tax=Anguilla anguilla TaxID=7936 RepID=UPI0015ACD4E3|nr:profilin-1 [Anguilla anguilla]XP_035265641.1 profilin-1 [Anguilla anguilla]